MVALALDAGKRPYFLRFAPAAEEKLLLNRHRSSDCVLPSLRDTLNTGDRFGWEEGQDVFEKFWYSQDRVACWSGHGEHGRIIGGACLYRRL